MQSKSLLLIWLSLAFPLVVHGRPASPKENVNRRQSSQTCLAIAQAQAAGSDIVPPSTALACLKSVPLDSERAAAFVDYLQPFIKFQSNIAFHKNPPSDYQAASGLGSVDILGGLDDIKQDALAKKYSSRYEFEVAVENLLRRAGDVHLHLEMMLTQVFTFVRPGVLISISKDGIEPPQLFAEDDFLESKAEGYEPSPVVQIDGKPVFEALQEISLADGRTHDLDAGFNSLMFGPARTQGSARYYNRLVSGPYRSLPDETTWLLANGTTLRFENLADATLPFYQQKIFTGAALGTFLDNFARQRGLKAREVEPRQQTCTVRHGFDPRPSEWPQPVVEPEDKYAGGFFLEGDQYADTAVLQINTFHSTYVGMDAYPCNAEDGVNYHRFLKTFVTKAKQTGKKKLIIDLVSNGGGLEMELADTFAQLFPDRHVPGFKWRARALPELAWLVNATFPKTDMESGLGDFVIDAFQTSATRGGWPATFGPEEIAGDKFTPKMFRDVGGTLVQFSIADRALTEPPFEPKNIVILTDGDCQSACGILVRWLTDLSPDVRLIVVGGRPTKGPMQGVGGTKGGVTYPLPMFQQILQMSFEAAGVTLPPSGLSLPSLKASPMGLFSAAVNMVDIWSDAYKDYPVEFAVELAHCRIFYTAETLYDLDALWKRAADAAWNGGKCAPGSTSRADGTIGGAPPAFISGVVQTPASVEANTADVRKVSAAGRNVMGSLRSSRKADWSTGAFGLETAGSIWGLK